MLGAQIIFDPQVTSSLPSVMPGRGTVGKQLWENRHRDPVRQRQEFLGPKGCSWLMRWLSARAYENGVYYVFTNPIGWDFDTVKPGLAMILDLHGEVLVESQALEDDVTEQTAGYHYETNVETKVRFLMKIRESLRFSAVFCNFSPFRVV